MVVRWPRLGGCQASGSLVGDSASALGGYLPVVKEIADEVAFLGAIRPSDEPIHDVALGERIGLEQRVTRHETDFIPDTARDAGRTVRIWQNGIYRDEDSLAAPRGIAQFSHHEKRLPGWKAVQKTVTSLRIGRPCLQHDGPDGLVRRRLQA